MRPNRESQRIRRLTLHITRVMIFIAIIVLIRRQHQGVTVGNRDGSHGVRINPNQLREFFTQAESIGDESTNGSRGVFDASGKPIGYVIQTSPASDDLIGFSGPTNALIAFSVEGRIVGVDVLSSGDTRDHVAQVQQDANFLNTFNGLTWDEAANLREIDAVAGATLTSITIHESIVARLGGETFSPKFPDPLTVDNAKQLFAHATSISTAADQPSLWNVSDSGGNQIGSIQRTSPHADNIIGYQGPTDALIGFDPAGRVVGISIGKSCDNDEYVKYVRDDEYFLRLFNGLRIDELAISDTVSLQVEGVSGATMTSMAVAEGLLVAANQHQNLLAKPARFESRVLQWTLRDFGTAVVILSGLAIALTPLRGNKRLRVCFQILLIGYLGLVNGDMISQAMIVGWAKHSVPWSTAGGLVMLTAAALVIPMTTRRNTYCTHLCPHGAAQHLLKKRLPWNLRLPRWLQRALKIVPASLLIWCVVVAMANLSFSLVDIEPFDAWVFRVAGWATITVAIVGLVASLFIPMAYCRYGCPTGAMLSFLRFNSRSERWSRRDTFAVALLALAITLSVTI